ncbi:glyoxalase [Janibacter melonis]|uniref:Glyoxalase n=1 Tax=Janibacter melonis TaxID=262209 RepID=A0A176QEB4_9MICO|nr:VOC family protein [Janibacter melonis]OAB88003.1 glyoxalase [Janibacter melonis]
MTTPTSTTGGAQPPLPRLCQTVLDTTDARGLAEFYRHLLGLVYRPGDEPPADGGRDAADWLVLRQRDGGRALAFQQVERLTPTTWPDDEVPMQIHVDCTVPDVLALEANLRRALDLGGRLVLDRSQDPEEPLYVVADPAGHPFCMFVG